METVRYVYNGANQIECVDDASADGACDDGEVVWVYDAYGNLTDDGTTTYTYDQANRLLSYGGSPYAYDGQGNRVGQTVDSVVTQYLLDVQPELWKVLAATTSGQTERYLHGPLGIHAQEDNAGDWRWIVPDALGSVRGEFDADLDMQAMRDYTPYGDPFGEQGSFAGPFSFTGEPMDTNGLLYLRARYYNADVGRFFQIDPPRLEQNLYQYGLSNPVRFTDHSGEQSSGICEISDWLCGVLRNFPGIHGCPCPSQEPPLTQINENCTPTPSPTPTPIPTPTSTLTPCPTDALLGCDSDNNPIIATLVGTGHPGWSEAIDFAPSIAIRAYPNDPDWDEHYENDDPLKTVYAVVDGTIVVFSSSPSRVRIRTDEGICYEYLHLAKDPALQPQQGQENPRIVAGTELGYIQSWRIDNNQAEEQEGQQVTPTPYPDQSGQPSHAHLAIYPCDNNGNKEGDTNIQPSSVLNTRYIVGFQ